MCPSSPASKEIRARIIEKFEHLQGETLASSYAQALNIFFDLSLEYESLEDFKSLCVFVPDICLSIPSSLYMMGKKGDLWLHRTTNPRKVFLFPEPISPDSASLSVLRYGDCWAFPIRHTQTGNRILGLLCLHRSLSQEEEAFFIVYASRIAKIIDAKEAASSNQHRLTFINTLIRDIGHNVIVPNMHFKLLFLQMGKQIVQLERKVENLPPFKYGDHGMDPRQEILFGIANLRNQLSIISMQFQQASLFLESLLRREHFEKGNYALLLRPCNFRSQILEPQIERFRPLLLDQGIRIEMDPEVCVDEDIVLEADLGLISQAFANLLSNAVKYTKAVPTPWGTSSKTLHYGWKSVANAFGLGRPGIKLFISTTGVPIPAQDANHLFEPDFRSHAPGTAEGSGHGLYFIKQIVELHKGKVGYDFARFMNIFYIILPCPTSDTVMTEIACPRPS